MTKDEMRFYRRELINGYLYICKFDLRIAKVMIRNQEILHYGLELKVY
jgi:hypothetical protein